MSSAEENRRILASLLRGDAVDLSCLSDPAPAAAFAAAAAEEGVEALVRRSLIGAGSWSGLPADVRAALDDRVRRLALKAASRQTELAHVATALRERGVDTLAFKGAALAASAYPQAYLRPSVDIDLLVRRSAVETASERLEALGYMAANSAAREPVQMQRTFRRRAGPITHEIDLHWAISNRPLFGAMFSFDELAAHAAPLAASSSVSVPDAVHCLLLAAIHRVAHHNVSPLLIWLYDVKLLADALSGSDWGRLWSIAGEKGLVSICRDTLAATDHWLGSDLCATQSTSAVADAREPSSAYLKRIESGWASVWLDVRHAPGVAARLRLIGAHAFPATAYMREKYGARTPVALGAAYLRRAASGVLRWRLAPVVKTRLSDVR